MAIWWRKCYCGSDEFSFSQYGDKAPYNRCVNCGLLISTTDTLRLSQKGISIKLCPNEPTKLEILQVDIDKAIAKYGKAISITTCCPIYQALNRYKFQVAEGTYYFVWKHNRRYLLDEAALASIRSIPYVEWSNIRPTTFQIWEWPIYE